MKFFEFLCLSIVLSFLGVSHAVCHSYATRCQATLGQSLAPAENPASDIFEVPATDTLYFTFSVSDAKNFSLYSCR